MALSCQKNLATLGLLSEAVLDVAPAVRGALLQVLARLEQPVTVAPYE